MNGNTDNPDGVYNSLEFETVNGETFKVVAWDDGDIGFTGTATLLTLDEAKQFFEWLNMHIGRME